MQSEIPTRLAALVLGLGLLAGISAGCVKVPTPGVYKLDVQQGNVVTEDMLARLEPNMEKRKVRFLLGTPLITDTFNENRWDYIYSLQQGGGARTQQHIILIFENDRLIRIEGDADNSALDIAPTPKPETVVSVPDQEPEGFFGGIGGWFGTDETRVPRKKPPPSEDESEEEEGFFASIFDGDADTESAPPSETETLPDNEEVEIIEPQEENELAPLPDTSDGYEENTTPESEESDDEDGFFARLKKKFKGDDETDEDTEAESTSLESTSADSIGEQDEEEGFFDRLSEQFGLDAPLESRDSKN